jgi:AcrR family transcriptional regulator
MSERPYSSPLRDSQVQHTRGLILDALSSLLSELPADEISTREIAQRAGVSQATVYRHYPDRQALLEGLSDRIDAAVTAQITVEEPRSLEDLVAQAVEGHALAEEHAVEAMAEALLNADPRRFSRASRARTGNLHRLVVASFPDYDERDHLRITALLRNLYTVQTWLRMREEFGIPGTESGPILAWAFQTLVDEIRAGNFPRGDPPE